MLGGFGFIKEMNKTLKHNRALLDRAKESYSRRKSVNIAKNQELRYNEMSPDQLARVSEFLVERAKKEKRRTLFLLILILAITPLTIAILILNNNTHTKIEAFSPVTSEYHEAIMEISKDLEIGLRVGNHEVFRDLWHEELEFDKAIEQSALHVFMRERNASLQLDPVNFSNPEYAEVGIFLIGVDSLITAKYRLKIYDNNPVITDFTTGEWLEKKEN